MREEPDCQDEERPRWNIGDIVKRQDDIMKRLEKLEHKENKVEEKSEKEWLKEEMERKKEIEKDIMKEG